MIRMSDSEWSKCLRLGGAIWIREQIGAADVPRTRRSA